MPRKLRHLYPVDGVEVIFDDFTEKHGDDYPESYFGWSQICEACVAKLEYAALDPDVGHGICGVEGCQNQADHYIDFDNNDVLMIEEE